MDFGGNIRFLCVAFKKRVFELQGHVVLEEIGMALSILGVENEIYNVFTMRLVKDTV